MEKPEATPLILIADDDPDDRMMIQEAFEERCPVCRLDFVQDGEELMAFLGDGSLEGRNAGANSLPDMLLLDLNMPLKDGRESLLDIRKYPVYAVMPIVVMTTSDSDDGRQFCLDNGADDYLVKPASYTEFLDAIQSLQRYFLTTKGSH